MAMLLFVITRIDVEEMLENNPIPNNILWWALSLGACLDGNLTMIGASANIVSVGMAKKLGHEISFLDFARKYVLTTYSHDIVDLKLIDYLITEDGKFQNR